jgi:FlaG/FlaF family flagellin (archaellin)
MTTPEPLPVPERKTKHAKAYVIGSVAVVVLILAAGVYLYRGSGSDQASVLSPQEQTERLNETGDAVAQMLKNQIVTKIEDDRGRVSVSASAWDRASYDQKASMAHALAKFCAAVHGTARMDCEIVDDQTGRRLARYTNDGLTLY